MLSRLEFFPTLDRSAEGGRVSSVAKCHKTRKGKFLWKRQDKKAIHKHVKEKHVECELILFFCVCD